MQLKRLAIPWTPVIHPWNPSERNLRFQLVVPLLNHQRCSALAWYCHLGWTAREKTTHWYETWIKKGIYIAVRLHYLEKSKGRRNIHYSPWVGFLKKGNQCFNNQSGTKEVGFDGVFCHLIRFTDALHPVWHIASSCTLLVEESSDLRNGEEYLDDGEWKSITSSSFCLDAFRISKSTVVP